MFNLSVCNLGRVIRNSFRAWNEHDIPRLGAALAFYTILSLAPLLILLIAILAIVFGHTTAEERIVAQAQEMVGFDGARALRTMIDGTREPAPGALASLIGVITLLVGASGVFSELRASLNLIWEVKPERGDGVIAFVRDRFFCFGMVLAIGFLLLVSLTLSLGLSAIGGLFGGFFPVPVFALDLFNVIITFSGIAVLFGLLFGYVPALGAGEQIAWREISVGSVVTAVLFTGGKFLIGLYLGSAGVGSAYGAAGSLIVVVVWVYYSSMIFFFGAEFTYALARECAVPVNRIRSSDR